MSRSSETSPRVAVLASGRGSNFESLARAFAAGEVPGRIVLLVVDKPRAGALDIAERFAVPSLVLKSRGRRRAELDAALLEVLRDHRTDYVFLAGFMRILGRPVVEAFWGRTLNIHPSLLPRFPGLHAHAQTLAAGVTESGCTVHFVDLGVDTGPIILQRRVPVLPGDTEDSLAARILVEEHVAYPEAARRVLTGEVSIEDLQGRHGSAPGGRSRVASADVIDILLVGGGGRENALARALARSPRTGQLIAAPGNPGIARFACCVEVAATDQAGLIALAEERDVGLVVVGPEQPLADGLVDALSARGIAAAGPVQAAALLEGSKVFAKETMRRLGIPQAEPYGVFDDFDDVERYLAGCDGAVVVKADGLAAGKGVTVADTPAAALAAAKSMLVDRRFGDAGRRVIVEPRLVGEEISMLFVCDGRRALPLVSARDYKALKDGDRGPNTGGMGTHSPGREHSGLARQVEETVVAPLLARMAADGTPYRGVLYCGLMLTADGPKVLEFNCRFGDPEAQVILPRLESCLVTLLEEAAVGSLEGVELTWDPRVALTVVLAAAGYPESPRSGDPIHGLDNLPEDVFVDHAGTRLKDGELVTAGGRVLAVGALGDDLAAARSRAYDAAGRITFAGKHFRTDIGGDAGEAP